MGDDDDDDATNGRMTATTEAFAMLGRAACAVVVVGTIVTAVDGFEGGGKGFSGTTGAPEGGGCGAMSANRVAVARRVMTCNQDDWREGCLDNYDEEDFSYVDGPGLTKIRGKREMERYLKNQFDFSRQFLTVEDEVCSVDAAGDDNYVATWRLDMLLGTGALRDIQGISVLKFAPGESNKIRYHRDYLPDGPIWERAPIVGPLVKLQRQTYTACMQSDVGCAKVLGGVE